MNLLYALLEVVAPTRFAGCDLPGELLCPRCRADLAVIERKYACPICGAPFGHFTCTECWQTDFAFVEARAVALLEPPLSRCVTLYKDGGERRLAAVLSELMLATSGEWFGWAEAVVPVPATPEAVRRRGFDHAYLLGEQVARGAHLPCCSLLISTGAKDQRKLDRGARLANTRSGFALSAVTEVPATCFSSTMCLRLERLSMLPRRYFWMRGYPRPEPVSWLASGDHICRHRRGRIAGAFTRVCGCGSNRILVQGRRGQRDPRKPECRMASA